MAGKRKSLAEKLSEEQILQIIDFYKNHTISFTLKKFNLTRTSFNIITKKYNVILHDSSTNELFKHLELDEYYIWTQEQKQAVAEFYKNNSTTITLETFNIKEYFLTLIIKEFNLEKHSVDEEIKLTSIYRYGVSCPLKNTEIRQKINKTISNRSEEEKAKINEKIKATKLERYGDENYNNRDKCVQTCEEKYGCINVFQNEDIKNKSYETKEKKYSNAKYTNPEQRKNTCLQKFGAESFLGSELGQEAIKKYNQDKFGTDYAFQSDIWQNDTNKIEKRRETLEKNKYTPENYSEKYLSIYNDIEKLQAFVKDKTMAEISKELEINRDAAYYLVSKNNLLDLVKADFTGSSHYEDEIINYIGENICIKKDRTVLNGKEIDVYIPSKNIGIEFNGTYWHSNLVNLDKNYHFDKSKLAEEKGIRLIHIYEYEWTDIIQQEKIKLMLDIALGRVKTKIYARNCEIKQINNNEAKKLNNLVHLQGHRNANVTYGLFFNNELVQLMSFSHTHYNKNLKSDNDWEIIRGCPGSNNLVVGGVSKLLKHFINDYKPNKIFSYCDFNKFNGKSYENAGMKFIGYTGPDMKWILKDGSVINRNPNKHAELKEQAVGQIFGAGSKKYLLELN